MNEVFPKYEINTPERIAAFIAQCGHESGGWRAFSENLNYSVQKHLMQSLASTLNEQQGTAQPYHRQPEKIANVVYAGSYGLMAIQTVVMVGSTEARGPIQLTGKAELHCI